MGVITCKDCKKQFSTDAKVCPDCGAEKPRKTSIFTLFIAIFFGIPIIMAIARASSQPSAPEIDMAAKGQQEAQDRAERIEVRHLIAETKAAMRNPDSFRLERALAMSNKTVCLSFRAQNGFGGMNIGAAVFPADRSKGKIKGMDGFGRLFKRECEKRVPEKDVTDLVD